MFPLFASTAATVINKDEHNTSSLVSQGLKLCTMLYIQHMLV